MFLIRSTGRNIHSTFGYKSLGIEEAAAHPLTAFYFEVTTAVKSRCVTVPRDALARFLSPAILSPSGALSYGDRLTCYQARAIIHDLNRGIRLSNNNNKGKFNFDDNVDREISKNNRKRG